MFTFALGYLSTDRIVTSSTGTWREQILSGPLTPAASFQFPRIWRYGNIGKKAQFLDFPGEPAVKNPPANAGDTGLIGGPGRFHTLRGN